ncbi:Aromatic-amino-acid aminotransferase [Morganella morganii]|nr:Aromatic-amino-acid aminotransferase [Morganella morganii]
MFEHVDAYGGDPILTLVEHFKQDPRKEKVNLSIGLYYDDSGVTPQLNSIAQAKQRYNAQDTGGLPVSADGRFCSLPQRGTDAAAGR